MASSPSSPASLDSESKVAAQEKRSDRHKPPNSWIVSHITNAHVQASGANNTPEGTLHKLSELDHALSLITGTTLRGIRWKSPLFSGRIFAHGLTLRLEVVVNNGTFSFPVESNKFRIIKQLALYLDSWDSHVRTSADLHMYRAVGLAKSRPTDVFSPNSLPRNVLLQVGCAAVSIDHILSAEVETIAPVHDHDPPSAAAIEAMALAMKAYQAATLPDNDVDAVYPSSDLQTSPLANLCREVLSWRDIVPLIIKAPSCVLWEDPAHDSSVRSRYRTLAIKAEAVANRNHVKSNVFKFIESLITLCGPFNVR